MLAKSIMVIISQYMYIKQLCYTPQNCQLFLFLIFPELYYFFPSIYSQTFSWENISYGVFVFCFGAITLYNLESISVGCNQM